MRRDSFQAIADPTRREILSIIANRALTINAVADNFEVSRTAVYKHIKILTECGLVVIRQRGRERYCEVQLAKLHEVSDWINQYSRLWDARFNTLDRYLAALQQQKKKASWKK